MTPLRGRHLRRLVPRVVVRFCTEFRSNGHACYLVGGAVRDMVMGRAPVDFDFTTDAEPEKVMSLFRRVIPTGVAHGTVTVLFERYSFEVTTYRAENTYTDGRHPDSVHFVSNIQEDLARRDFTMNAIAYDPVSGELLDPHDGVSDIRARTIRAIGDPSQRFAEDALRMLRAARFAAQLEFTIDPDTAEAVKQSPDRISVVSAERVRDELSRLIASPRPSEGIRLLLDLGLLQQIIPELVEGIGVQQRAGHVFDVFDHSLHACDVLPSDRIELRFAALLHDIGKPRSLAIRDDGERTFHGHDQLSAEIADAILERLRFSNEFRKRVVNLVRHHMFDYTTDTTDAAVRRLLRRVGPENIQDLIDLRQADRIAVRGNREDAGQWAALIRRHVAEIQDRDDALAVSDLLVNGTDLIALGIPPGPLIGVVLEFLLETVIDDPGLNTRERLLEIADRYYRTRLRDR